MNWDVISKLLLVLVPLVVGVLQYWPRDSRRSRIKADVELYALLPEDLAHRDALKRSIERQVRELVEGEAVQQRHWPGAVFSAVLAGFAVYALALAFKGGWWLLMLPLGVFILAISASMFVQDLQKRERDERGRPLPKPGIEIAGN